MLLSAPSRYQNPVSHIGVIERAASATGFDAALITGPGRWEILCEIRFAIMLVLRARGLSLPAIGRLLHRDHSTVFSGLERAEKLRAAGGDFARLCEVIEQ